MTANTVPLFGLTPNNGQARVAGANTASDGSTPGGGTAIADIFTAGANGSIVNRIRYANSQVTAAASSAMVVRIFETDASNANPRLIMEFAVAAATRSTIAVGVGNYIDIPGGKPLKSGQHLKICQSVYAGAQDQMDYTIEGWDY